MDDAPPIFWEMLDRLMQSVEEEQILIEEILMDGFDLDDFYENGNANVYEDIEQVIQQLFGDLLLQEMMEMIIEDDEVLELINEPGERHIDWRADLPPFDYFRNLEDPYFLQHFRMDRHAFELLIVEFGNHLVLHNRLQRLRTPLDKCLLMSLWILANLDTFRSTGRQFGCSRSTVHFNYVVVIEALRELAPKFIKWPSPLERDRIKQRILERTQFPDVVGMMDGTLINITAPNIQKERYIDRHQSYSINVLAVCDDQLLFRDVYVGNPGSVHDIRVFQRSSLHDFFLEREDIVAAEEHILADGGFELTNKVLIPFRDLGHLTPRQVNFNYMLSSIRMCIERAFGRLKGKWRRLYKFFSKRYEYTMDHIVACFVLHNFILLEGREANGIHIVQPERPERNEDEIFEEDNEENEDQIRDGVENNVLPHPLLAEAKRLGRIKREELADLLVHVRANE